MSAAARLPLLSSLVALLLAAAPVAGTVEVPYLTGRVVDTAEVLSAEAHERVTALLKAHEERTTNQIAVLTVPALEGESVEDFAARVFKAWRLGQADRDNGVLLLVAPRDRRMRIEVGYGLEPALTDLAAGRIIRDVMTPRFRSGDLDAGVEEGARAIIAVLEGSASDVDGAAGHGSGVADDRSGASGSGRSASGFHLEGPDLSVVERILLGAFIFGIIGLFTVIGVMTPGVGWFLYVFLIPFWAAFPIAVVGVKAALVLLVVYLVAFPVTKLGLSRSAWYRKASRDLKTKGRARIGGFTFGSSGGSGGGSWSSGSGGSSGGGFSGGGGSSGGGGASGSW
jgi:uncharacterized protein